MLLVQSRLSQLVNGVYVNDVKMYAMEGRFTFTSHSPGEHGICIHSNSTAWFSAAQLVSHTLTLHCISYTTSCFRLINVLTDGHQFILR